MSPRIVAFLLVLMCSVYGSVALAQDARETIHSRTLANGLTVIVLPSDTVPIVTIELCVKNGAFTEPPEYNGLSHLYEHMFFKGNAVIPNQEAYLRRIRQLGIVFNGTTSTERVNYFFTLPSDNLKPGLEFMRDALLTPTFDPEEFAREKEVIFGEIDRNESNPYYWFSRAMGKKLWFEHPTRKDPLGDRESVRNATVAQMRTMKERYYIPNNSAILIAGNVSPAEAFALVESTFSRWRRGPDPFMRYPVPSHPPLARSEFVVVDQDVQVPYVEFSWHGPSVDDDPGATYAADVLSYIVEQNSSQFYQRLVDSGLTLGARLSYFTQRHTGPISLGAAVGPDNLLAALDALLDEVRQMAQPDYFTDEQLENAKKILAIQDIYEREKLSSFIHVVSFWWATAGLDYYLNYVENLQKVTREDIARYVERYIIDKPFVLGVMANSQTISALELTESSLRERFSGPPTASLSPETTP